jgi:hypothetical protein
LKIGEVRIASRGSINVMGDIFDTKLKQSTQGTKAIKKANVSLKTL